MLNMRMKTFSSFLSEGHSVFLNSKIRGARLKHVDDFFDGHLTDVDLEDIRSKTYTIIAEIDYEGLERSSDFVVKLPSGRIAFTNNNANQKESLVTSTAKDAIDFLRFMRKPDRFS